MRRAVVPLLIGGISDPDPGVRAVAATYLGIIHEGGADAVNALIEALEGSSVRMYGAPQRPRSDRSGADAQPAIPRCARQPRIRSRRRSGSGVALVKLQPHK